jgi:uncharacterized DUF497 family protein
MNFEWDRAKNEDNIRKHYLDFSDAHEIFDGPMLAAVDDRFDYGEVRTRVIGVLRNLIVVIVFSEIDDDTIRIISLRRALKSEREKFYEYLRNRLG